MKLDNELPLDLKRKLNAEDIRILKAEIWTKDMFVAKFNDEVK